MAQNMTHFRLSFRKWDGIYFLSGVGTVTVDFLPAGQYRRLPRGSGWCTWLSSSPHRRRRERWGGGAGNQVSSAD